MLVIKRIHTVFHLVADPEVDRSVVDRVNGFVADKCPVARSLRGAIEVTTSVELVDGPAAEVDDGG